MQVIDAHMHFSNIKRFVNTSKNISHVNYSKEGLNSEIRQNNIRISIAMGVTETTEKAFPDANSQNPMGVDLEEDIPQNLKYCIGINPYNFQNKNIYDEVENIENELKKSQVVGIKMYPGYYPFHIIDDIYSPVYELAKKHNKPVTIHTGDTFSYRGYLKVSHPLDINELANRYKDINFVIAHFGNPWIMDAALVISNNSNVYADLSGLIVGDSKQINNFSSNRLFIDNIKRGLVYDNIYNKLMFGTDWPLVNISAYIEFIKMLIPEEYHQDVFYNNAVKIYRL